MADIDTDLLSPAVMKKILPKPLKVSFVIVILLAVVIITFFVYKTLNKQETEYLSMMVKKGSIVNEIDAMGTISPLHEVDLYFKNQGTLEILSVSSGDSVEKGSVLAVQDDSTLQAEVQQCQSDLQQAKLKMEQSKDDYDKTKSAAVREDSLYKAGLVAKTDWEQTNRDLKSAEVNLKLAEISINTSQAKLIIAQDDLKNATITAPFSGVVSEVNGEVGQETGNSSSGLLHLISNDLQIEVMVNEADIGNVKVGQDVNFSVKSFTDKTFNGTVSKISQQAKTTNSVQLFEVDIATKDLNNQLKAGMSVSAKIITEKQENVITIPNLALSYAQTNATSFNQSNAQSPAQSGPPSALSQTKSKASSTVGNNSIMPNNKVNGSSTNTKPIVILENDKPVVKQITIGLSDGTNTKVKSGLSVGDKVVIGTNDVSQTSSSGSSSPVKNSNKNSSGSNGRSGGGGMMGGPMP